jgi:hypothetical protein
MSSTAASTLARPRFTRSFFNALMNRPGAMIGAETPSRALAIASQQKSP